MPYDKAKHTTILLEKERVAALREKAQGLGLPFAGASNAGLVRAVLDLWLGLSASPPASSWPGSGPTPTQLAERLDKLAERVARLESAELDAAIVPAPAAGRPPEKARVESGGLGPEVANEPPQEETPDNGSASHLDELPPQQKGEARRLAVWRALWAKAGERVGSETPPMGWRKLEKFSGVHNSDAVKTAIADLLDGGFIERAATVPDHGTCWRVMVKPSETPPKRP